MAEQGIDSAKAAEEIGVTLATLHTWLHRHPEYRPRRSFGGSYLWSKDEIQRVIEARRRKREN